jgi:GNAT superfamily N-acetyltransferase
VDVNAVTASRWDDVEQLFGTSGAYASCWCTWWRLSAKDWNTATPQQRRRLLADVVAQGDEPGLLAYRDGVPVGWVAVAPREQYPRLNRSPHTRPVDDLPVWAVTCFWIPRANRGQGIATALLHGAVTHARDHLAAAVEGYPIDPAVRTATHDQSFTGVIGMFERAGFIEVARRTATSRVVMRRDLGSG